MEQALVTGALWFCAVGCGLMAGVYFTFSAFVMRALGAVAPPAGIAAMNAVNRHILRSPFMPLFLGTTLAGAGLAVWGGLRWTLPGAAAALAGGVLHVAGMFAVTMARNVPLNEALAACDPAGAEGAALWRDYLKRWTAWNHVRTAACTLAAAAFTLALVQRG